MTAAPVLPPAGAGPLVLSSTLFAALVWVTLLLVLAVFAFVLYGVLRAGGVDLSSRDGH